MADDDSQALQGLLELMFNLGAFGLSSDLEQELPQVSNQLPNQVSDRVLDVEIVAIAESSDQNLQPIAIDQNSDTALVISFENDYSIQPKENEPQNNSVGIASLQTLLLGSDLQILQSSVKTIDARVQDLEHQIYDPQELIQLLVPVITNILGIKVSEASAEITNAIAPVIDQMITVNIDQGPMPMTVALAPVMSSAIAENIVIAPGEFATAIGSEMGMAIHEQLRINKGVLVDALYPIIGNTIAKYMAEAIKAINEKVEHTLSPEGIFRKIRARMQGVSEAELIIKESMPVIIRAIFLVHKASGLIISEVQNPDSSQILESEMVAGLLTAIRSFVNDCIAQSRFDAELSEIDYGGSKIMLEAAGHCYMAVVVDGATTPHLISKIRQALEAIVEIHSKNIEDFDGDLTTVSPLIEPALRQLFSNGTATKENKPNILLILFLVLIGAIAIPWALIHNRSQKEAQIKTQVVLALATAPELSVYGLTVDISQDRVNLTGRVPNLYLQVLAGKIATAALTNIDNPLVVNNQIIPVNIPPDPLLTKSEVKRVTTLLNQLDGIKIATDYDIQKNKVTITGTVPKPANTKIVNAAFAQIPGVAVINTNMQVQPPQITTRIYFDYNSALVAEAQIPKILQMKSIMDQYPSYQLKIIGHSDRQGDFETNLRIALNRAQVVKGLLTKAGLAPTKVAIGTEESMKLMQNTELKTELSPELNRYVGFELISNLYNK